MIFADIAEVDANYFLEKCITLKIEDVRSVLTKVIPNRTPGIYCFYNIDGYPLYLGQTVDLKSRIKNHISGTSSPTKELAPSLQFISFLPIDCDHSYSLFRLERKKISEIKPLFNGASRGTEAHYGYRNLRKWFNSNTIEYGIFPEKVISNRIHSFLEEESYIPATLDFSKVRIATSFNSTKLAIPRKEIVAEDFEPDEDDDGMRVDTQVIREAIKLLISNCRPSDELDCVIDGLIGLQAV